MTGYRLPASMKVSPLSPPTAAAEQEDVPHHDNSGTATNTCSSLKRRRLHSQTNIIINNHYRHRKHLYPRDDDKSSPMNCFEATDDSVNSNDVNSCNSGEDASDRDESSSMTPGSHPTLQYPCTEGGTSSPTFHHRHDKKVRAVLRYIILY